MTRHEAIAEAHRRNLDLHRSGRAMPDRIYVESEIAPGEWGVMLEETVRHPWWRRELVDLACSLLYLQTPPDRFRRRRRA